MRGGRSLLVLFVVALALGAYIYFVEADRDPSGTEPRETLFAVDPADIREIEIRGTETSAVRRIDDAWTLTAPVSAPADASVLDSIASSLSSISIERVLEDNVTDLAPYGLDEPRVSVAFTTESGTRHELHLGSTTPTQSGLYARTADSSRLLLIPAYLESTFNRSAFDLRDRRVLSVDRNTIDRVTLAVPGQATIDLRREDMRWRLAAPVETRADVAAADGIVSRITNARMSDIEIEDAELTPAALRRYGLDAPRLTASLGSGSTAATLAIGRTKDETSVYARDLSRSLVFSVDSSLLTDLQKTPDDLRAKDVFEFNAFSAQAIEITQGPVDVAYTKSTTADDEPTTPSAWSQTRPENGDVNQTALTDLLNTLSSLRADRFVGTVPSDSNEIAIVARYGSAGSPNEERVVLRRSGDTAYAVRAGEPGAAVIPLADLDTVASQLKTLVNPDTP